MDKPFIYRGPVIWGSAEQLEEEHAMLEFVLEEYKLTRPQIRAAMDLQNRVREEELRAFQQNEAGGPEIVVAAEGTVVNPIRIVRDE